MPKLEKFPHFLAAHQTLTSRHERKTPVFQQSFHRVRVRVRIMRCLKVKLAKKWQTLGVLLKDTEDKAIVELSYKDVFWGVKPLGQWSLAGMNVLRLLMELRKAIDDDQHEQLTSVAHIPIPYFLLFNSLITTVTAEPLTTTLLSNTCLQTSLFDFIDSSDQPHSKN